MQGDNAYSEHLAKKRLHKWVKKLTGAILDGQVEEHFIIDPRVLEKISADPGTVPDTRTKPTKWKFYRVYKGPGYPTDPRHNKARAKDSYVNAFAPKPVGTLDRTPLIDWLNRNMN